MKTPPIFESKDRKPFQAGAAHSGKYIVERALAEGGMKTILRVADSDTGRDVAMAVMNDPSTAGRDSFLNEARITAQLEHPNIVPVHEIGVDASGAPYFTMKLISGVDLARILDRLAEGNPNFLARFTLPHLLDIFQKVCDAVSFAHSKGIIHLDLKPENIQVGEFGEVLVLDWGLAKRVGEADSRPPSRTINTGIIASINKTLDGVVKGTPAYMSPEQAAGLNSSKDVRTDIYALGAILYSMLTFRPPVNGATSEEIISNALHGRILPARDCAPKSRPVPPALEFVAYKAMERSPRKRYQSVAELKDDIESYVAGYATSAEEAGLFTQIWLLLLRKKTEAAFLGVALVVILSIVSFFVVHLNNQRSMATKALFELKAAESAMRLAEARNAGLEERIKSEGRREWRLGFEEGFNDKYVLERWTATKGAHPAPMAPRELENCISRGPEGLNVSSPKDSVNLCLKSAVPEDAVRVVYEATWMGGSDGGISCVVHGASSDAGYLFILGGSKNSKASIVAAAGQRVLAETPFSLVPRKRYRVQAQVVRGPGSSELRLEVEGHELLSAVDRSPAPVNPSSSKVGFITVASSSVFHNMKIYALGVPLKAELLDIAERHLNKGNYSTAADLFSELEESSQDPAKRQLASEGLHLAKLLNEYKSRMPDWEEMLVRTWPDSKARLTLDREGFCVELEGKAVRDLSPLRVLPVSVLKVSNCSVSDLSTLKGMRLSTLDISGNSVSSLAPLEGLPLKKLVCDGNPIKSLAPLAGISSLAELSVNGCGLASLEEIRKLRLARLDCSRNSIRSLDPLKGMPLKELDCSHNSISSLAALADSPLETLDLHMNPLQDLKPLSRLKLKSLNIDFCSVSDLSPLSAMSLSSLSCSSNSVESLEPLRKMPLRSLLASANKIKDLSPLSECRSLETLSVEWNSVSSLAPLAGLSVKTLRCDGNSISSLAPLRSMKSLKALYASLNSVSDLSPLSEDFSLSLLDCSSNPVRSLAPLDSLSLDFLWCGNARIDLFGKSLAYPPRRCFVFDSPSLGPDTLERLGSMIGAGPYAKALENSIAALKAFKKADVKALKSHSFSLEGSSFVLVPSMKTCAQAIQAAASVGARLPVLKTQEARELLARRFSVPFWCALQAKGGEMLWPDSTKHSGSDILHVSGEGFYVADSGALAGSDSEQRMLPLVLEWPRP